MTLLQDKRPVLKREGALRLLEVLKSLCVHTCVCMCMCVSAHVCLVCLHCVHVCTLVCMHVHDCACVSMFVCMHVCVPVLVC